MIDTILICVVYNASPSMMKDASEKSRGRGGIGHYSPSPLWLPLVLPVNRVWGLRLLMKPYSGKRERESVPWTSLPSEIWEESGLPPMLLPLGIGTGESLLLPISAAGAVFSALPADISRLIGPVKQPGCLRIHFLNVGHGDCTVIQHPSGRVTVVDINNGETMDEDSCEEILDCQNPLRHYPPLYPMVFNPFPAPLAGMSVFESQKEQLKKAGYSRDLTNPIQFLKERIRIRSIFRYIQTHPDLDHMRGLSVLVKEFSIENFWDTVHTKTEQDVQQFDMPDWNAYIGLRNGKETMNHVKPRKLELYQDSRNQYWVDDGIEILSPSFGISFLYHKHSKRNNLSYVLRVSHNGINVILGGDAEKEAWEDIVGNHKKSLKCDVLKASHHGRNSGYHLEAVQAMSPKYVIVSVGKKPDQDASNRYRCQGAEVLSTRWHGNISLTIDSQGEMSWVSEKKR